MNYTNSVSTYKEGALEVYDPPAVLASYTVEELVAEATVCMQYGPYPAPGNGG
jgi:hypothetical protein